MLMTQNVQKSSQKIRTLKKIRDNQSGILIYNGGSEAAVLTHDAVDITFPPDGDWIGPDDMEPQQYDGVTVVKDRYGISREAFLAAKKKGGDIVTAMKSTVKDALIAHAIDVALRAEQKLGLRGVVVLTGDPGQDETLKKNAREAWIRWRVERAERTRKNYRERTRSFYSDPRNNGQDPPAMTDFETIEQMFLDEYNTGSIGGRKHKCPERCGFQHDDGAVMVRHVKGSHPATARDAKAAAVTADAERVAEPGAGAEQPQRPQRGRKKKAALAETA